MATSAVLGMGAIASGVSASASPRPAATSSGGAGVNCHGCGAGKTIRVWVEGVGTTDQQAAWEAYVARRFKVNTGAKAVFTTMSTGSEVLNAIEQGAATNTGPDVIDTANSYNGDAEAAHIYKPITSKEWALIGGKSRFTPGVLSKAFTGGNTVAWYLHTDLLAYNTKLFKEAGIKQAPTTWAQYVHDASLITKLGNGTYGAPFSAGDPYDPWHETYTITRDMGGNFVNKSATQATLNSATVAKAFEFWFSWYKSGLTDPSSITWTGNQTQALFLEGKLGMENQVNQGLITAAIGTPVAHDIAFAPMPTIPVGATTLPAGAPKHGVVGFDFAYTMGVPRWSSDPSLSYRFVQVATSPAAESLLYRLTASLPTTVAAGQKVIKLYPSIKPFVDYAGEAVVAPSYAFWGSVENALAGVSATLARDVQNGSYSDSAVQSALATANAQVQAAINSTKSGG